jgi:hypothetical protein
LHSTTKCHTYAPPSIPDASAINQSDPSTRLESTHLSPPPEHQNQHLLLLASSIVATTDTSVGVLVTGCLRTRSEAARSHVAAATGLLFVNNTIYIASQPATSTSCKLTCPLWIRATSLGVMGLYPPPLEDVLGLLEWFPDMVAVLNVCLGGLESWKLKSCKTCECENVR